jgi:hypothetical protein
MVEKWSHQWSNKASLTILFDSHQTPTFWFVVSIFQYFQVFDKTLCTIGLQPILWIPNAHGIKQCMQKESIVHLHQLGNHTYEKT